MRKKMLMGLFYFVMKKAKVRKVVFYVRWSSVNLQTNLKLKLLLCAMT